MIPDRRILMPKWDLMKNQPLLGTTFQVFTNHVTLLTNSTNHVHVRKTDKRLTMFILFSLQGIVWFSRNCINRNHELRWTISIDHARITENEKFTNHRYISSVFPITRKINAKSRITRNPWSLCSPLSVKLDLRRLFYFTFHLFPFPPPAERAVYFGYFFFFAGHFLKKKGILILKCIWSEKQV